MNSNDLQVLILLILFILSNNLNAINELEIVWQTQGEQEDDNFGGGIATLDFNGDGIDDLAVSAPMYNVDDNYHMHRGSLYLYFGSNNGLSEIPDISIYTAVDSNLILNNNWWNINNLGDMNGDGCDDLGYTQKTNQDYNSFHSECKILLGGTEPDTIPDYSYEMPSTQVLINPLGDINGDGFDDAGITDGSDPVSYYIVYGGSFEVVPFRENIPSDNGTFFVGLGDINSDGYDDFTYYIEGEYQGVHYNAIFLGNNIQDSIPDFEIIRPDSLVYAFFGLAPAGDWNNDGYDDFVSTGPEADGCVLWLGGELLDTVPDYHLAYFSFGFFPSYGDINGDGKGDLVSIYSLGYIGYLYMYLGDQNGTYDYIWGYHYDSFGSDAIGDFNNDGYDDIAAGARGNSSYPDYGQAFVLGGHSDLVEQDPDIEVNDNTIPISDIEFNVYPNPFNPEVNFEIKINQLKNEIGNNRYKIEIYNIKGQKVETLDVISNKMEKSTVTWYAEEQTSGIYFCKLVNNTEILSVRKVTLLK